MNKVALVPAVLAGVVVGVVAGAALTWLLVPQLGLSGAGNQSSEPQPLYWVAPMDPNYRRDKPGKSPMGMDLIPVYAEDEAGQGEGPGTITISPEVVNNLGVRTATAHSGVLLTEIHTVGYVQYNQDKLIHVHPRVQGWVEKLYVKAEGDPVAKDQPLYDLYSPELVNAQEEYLLALERNNQRLISAAHDRLKALQINEATIRQLRERRRVSQTITLYSPQKGVVDNLNIREGFFIQPGTTVMSIGALDEVWVEAEVFERQASLVQVGAEVTMTLDYLPGRSWSGKVDYVYPTLDKQTRTIKLRMRFANPDAALKPNMFAQVMIHARTDSSNVLIPREALIRTGKSDRVVLALGGGRFKSIEVKVGRMAEERVEILEGLAPGETVVTAAQFLLDSESSKTSDFKRMHHEEPPSTDAEADRRADVMGVINGVDVDNRVLNISREAIPKWGREAATMDFDVAQSVDMTALRPGMQIHFEFEITPDWSFVVTQVHVLEQGTQQGTQQESSHD
ncbi:efflux RND transporter periplasmic adaptor subunit [Ketobacter sp.]|uniref:efflux RND transporter periplasmic adaptor subunit n=1 Tax=Ketobacter sp. TaxID=2083498 RepID=UPI000F11C664|nr:efflux RND transporter periplasmic adaptor subunit [Ketobacter sp.]RLT93011.1 MAG: efflux RND transporter periplasmic adaptor subunit [Ketobacter sp.]